MPEIVSSGRTCWASPLGECHGKITSEHIVSQCLFNENLLMVQGLDWCRDAPKQVGKANLTRNILCKTHNSALSDLDNAALAAFDAFRESVKLSDKRKGLNTTFFTFRRFPINGPLLERWFLKTLINVTYKGNLFMGTEERGIPSLELVEIAFGIRRFPGFAGLYVSAKVGENLTSEDRVRIVTKSEGENLAAAGFVFRGYRFLLSLVPQKLTLDGDSPLMYRATKLKFTVHNNRRRALISHQISLEW